MLPAIPRQYLLNAIEGTPEVLAALLRHTPADSPAWDLRPDPERFTLREALAHWADWEPIWRQRVTRTRDEDGPFLPSVDEGQLAVQRDYVRIDPQESLHRLEAERPALVALLRSLPEEAWERSAEREFIGPLTITEQALLLLSHDGYHLRQAAQWLEHARAVRAG